MRYLYVSLVLSAFGLMLYFVRDAAPGVSSLALMTFAVAAFTGPEP